MTSSSNSPSEKAPLPPTATWDELAAALPKNVAELGEWIDRDLSTIELRFIGFMTEKSLQKSMYSERLG